MTPSTTSGNNGGRAARAVRTALACLFWLLLWQAAYLAVNKEILLVSPWTVFARILTLARGAEFWLSLAASLARVLAGYLLGAAAGFLVAWAVHFLAAVDALARPVIEVMRTTPVASFILLAMVWIRSDLVPIFTTFLMVMPLVFSNVAAGLAATDRGLLEMARVYRFGRLRTGLYVYLPSVRPHFFAALTGGLGFAWKAGVAAEVLCIPKLSIGRQLYNAKIYIETADLFAWTAVVILLSALLERGLRLALRRFDAAGEEGARNGGV